MITVHTIPVLSDNYCYVLEAGNGDVAIIDPGEAAPVLDFLAENRFRLSCIYITHHHGDHIGGLKDVLAAHPCNVYGPASENEKIPEINKPVDENSNLLFGDETLQVIETPGHTSGQINYYFPESHILFSADALFVMGCGRVIEGTMEHMFDALQKLKTLPDATQIYCGHEYTLDNAKFASHVMPDNEDIAARLSEVKEMRELGLLTVPSSISREKQTNPFLIANNIKEFEELRSQKDNF